MYPERARHGVRKPRDQQHDPDAGRPIDRVQPRQPSVPRVPAHIWISSLARRARQGLFRQIGASSSADPAIIAPMYIPAHFRPDDDEVRELLRHPGAANLITATAEGLLATMLPLAFDEGGAGPGSDVGRA